MANTRITQGVIKPNENYDTHNIVSTGIVTAVGLDVNGNADISGSLSVGGVLTYEDVSSIDSVGIITAQKDIHVGAGVSAVGVGTFGGLVSPYADIDDFLDVGSNIKLGNAGIVTAAAVDVDDFLDVGSNIKLGNAGVITATSFVGSGAALTGIDATAIKDSGGNVKVQAQASGAMYTGIHTFSSGAEVGSNIKLGNAGVITATSFSGDGSNLTSLPAGLGTALSSTQSSPLNKIYYTNTVLPVESTITVDTPASASAAYTQYADISVGSGADLIISDGDDLIPDVLGLRPDGTFGGGALGRMRVDKIVGKDANSAVSFEKGIVITGVTTSTAFVGNLTGNVTGNISGGTVAGSTGTFSGAVSGTTGTFTGDLTIPDKIVHTGDTDTAIRLGVDTVTVETAGNESLRVTSDRKVGINRTSPTRHLHVYSPGAGFPAKFESAYSYSSVEFADTGTVVVPYVGSKNDDVVAGIGNTERIRITSDGKLTLNYAATPPSEDVMICTSGQASPAGVTLSHLSGGNRYGARLQTISGTNQGIAISGLFNSTYTERFRIGNAGQIGLSGANYGTSGQALVSQGSGSAAQWADVSSAAGSVYDTFHGQGFSATSGNGYYTSGWGKPGGPGGSWANGPSGKLITESSGIFSFPSTGIYYISHRLQFSGQNINMRIGGNRIYGTNSNANPPAHQLAEGQCNINSFSGTSNGYGWAAAFCECIVKITNITNDKVAFWWQSSEASNIGSGVGNMAVFIKIADLN